ncbi:MAG: uridine kinase [Myxococcales bacterium]|nr:uridine kinase [Myxococcales bacterium]
MVREMAQKAPIVIGVAGGSGSGKTTVVREIQRLHGNGSVVVLQHDWYYRDRSGVSSDEREHINYDHPDALETELMVEHVAALRSGEAIAAPIYDFKTHTRSTATKAIAPHEVIVVDGILILADSSLRELMDIRIFVDTDADIRLARRINRDIVERGRTLESVMRQYLETVRPMHLEFVEPSKRYAHVIFPEGGLNRVAVDMLATKITSILDAR